MIYEGHLYNILVVSSSEKMNDSLKPLLKDRRYSSVTFTSSIASAKRHLLENSCDFIIVNAPLTDDFGTKFAIDVSSNKNTVCMLLVKTDLYDEINAKMTEHGIFTLPKPTSSSMFVQAMQWMASARERLRKSEKKAVSIEEKMEEIRIVNRAKWLLIENLSMSEPDAHRYIEKQAMDTSSTKREIAENIIKTYT